MGGRLTLLVPRIGYGALLVAATAVPVVFSRSTAESFMIPKVTVLWLCLLVSMVATAAWTLAARRSPIPRARVLIPIAVLVAWTALATALSTSPTISFEGQYARYDGFLGLVAGVLLLLGVVGYTWREPARLDRLVWAIVAAAAAGAAYVTIQQAGLDPIAWRSPDGRPIPNPYGLLGNSNFSGAYLGIAIPLLLALRTRASNRPLRWACWAGTGWFGLCILFTGTRGGILAATGGTAAAGLLVPDLFPRLLRWGAVAATGVAAVLLVVAAAVNTVPGSDLARGGSFFSSSSLADRQDIWAAGAGMIADHPLVGVGPDAFGLHFFDYVHPRAAAAAPLNADEAHDLFVDRAATAGLPALAAYLALLVVVASSTWRARRRVPEQHRWLVAGFGGALAAYLLQGLTSIDVVPLAVTGWLTLGALVSLTDPAVVAARDALGDRPTPLRPLPIGVAGAALIVLVLGGYVAIRPFAADVRYRDAIEAGRDGRPRAVAAADLDAAIGWFPSEPRYHSRLGDELYAIAVREAPDPGLATDLLDEARTAYDQALALAPGDVGIERARARVDVKLASVDPTRSEDHLRAAEAAYSQLVRRVHLDAGLHAEYGVMLELWSATTNGAESARLQSRALAQYDQCLAISDRSTTALSGMARIAVAQGRLTDARSLLRRAQAIRPADTAIATALEQVEHAIADAGG